MYFILGLAMVTSGIYIGYNLRQVVQEYKDKDDSSN